MPGTLLVTGDDFGRSRAVNEAVEGAHRRGILTGASLMVTAPAARDAVERARGLPELSTGLHLVLCDGRPASPPERIPELVDAAGRLETSPLRAGLRYWHRRHRLREPLEREVRAQIEAHLATGLALDHLDGHHHLHMHPVVFEVLLRCLGDYGIPWVRLVHEDGAARHGPRWRGAGLVGATFAALARGQRRRLAAREIGAPERVYGLRATGRMREDELVRLLGHLRASLVEIYAHPDAADERGRREQAALCSPAVRRAVERVGYRLAGSRMLAARTGP